LVVIGSGDPHVPVQQLAVAPAFTFRAISPYFCSTVAVTLDILLRP
jgi:hypothetical protein